MFFVDPSIICSSLNINSQYLIDNLNFTGFIFESLVIKEILSFYFDNEYELFYYHDNYDLEVDLIIKNSKNEFGGIEIKLGAN
jgi:predicted AAA+ superfamily ATPase